MPPENPKKRAKPEPEVARPVPQIAHKPYTFKHLSFNTIEFPPNCCQPAPRHGHRMCVSKDYIYVIGGANYSETSPHGTLQVFDEIWKYTLLTRKWELLKPTNSYSPADTPTEFYCHCVFFLSKNAGFGIYGGTGPSLAGSNSMYIFTFATQTWRKIRYLNSEHLPPLAYGQSMIFDGNNGLYVSGGKNAAGECNLDIYHWNHIAKTWRLVAEKPEFIQGRFRHEMFRINDRLYFIGGQESEETLAWDQVPVYDLTLNVWGQEPVIPDPIYQYPAQRFGQTSFFVANKLIITGGQDKHNIYADIWSLNLANFTWKFLEGSQLPQSVSFSAASCNVDGLLTFYGGKTSLGGLTTGALFQTWTKKMPSLKRLAMEVLFHKLDHEVWNDYAAIGEQDEPTEKKKTRSWMKERQIEIDNKNKIVANLHEQKIIEYFKKHHTDTECLNLPGLEKFKRIEPKKSAPTK